MKVAELVERAAEKKGSALELAREMRKAPARLSEWKSGKRRPDAAEIAYLAKVAGLPVLITLAFVEKDLHPESAELWDAALGEAKAPSYWSRLGADCALC
ncbi:helix-turn-helix transcriptional regulator [Aquabacterium sp. A08]|uniref:helix-turn-helix domain-containing protein n=1 Tax=Aquabacterium sp. A08 TaxID=2718532 RepID=UPI00141E045F|nr:helix-turn-helix transcriptional regulator [Aquabacterium sp. A08]NIC43557.1 helix-turn-helix transcriptional regulator [Aquabacterium sp. A08]